MLSWSYLFVGKFLVSQMFNTKGVEHMSFAEVRMSAGKPG